MVKLSPVSGLFGYGLGNLRGFGGVVWVFRLVLNIFFYLVGHGFGWLARARLLSCLFSIPGVASIVYWAKADQNRTRLKWPCGILYGVGTNVTLRVLCHI